jgi:hypothetical protein
MIKHLRGPMVLVAALSCLLFGIVAAKPNSTAESRAKPVPLDEATMIVEVNATAGDAGLQVFLDGEPWKWMRISGPDGSSRRLLSVETNRRLRKQGLTELFTESSEPTFEELPLEEFKRRFPEGRYSFEGRTIEGQRLVGRAELSHDIPKGPEIISPAEGATVERGEAVAAWGPGDQPPSIDIAFYRAIVEREDPLRVFSVDLPASVTSVPIPSQFLKADVEYLFELQAIEASGNITFSETHFRVE